MKFFDMNESSLQNNDDTLIHKLNFVQDDKLSSKRTFGVEIHNRHRFDIYNEKKNKNNSIENYSQYKITEKAARNIPLIEKQYQLDVLASLAQNDYPIKIQNSYKHERNLIANWLALIHTRYPFGAETLHEALWIFDKFLSVKVVQVEDYEKYALTSLWMSAKIEERKVKQLKLWITFGKGYVIQQILQCQKQILQSLDNKLISSSSQRFLVNFLTFLSFGPKMIMLSSYLVELALLNIAYRKFPNSIIALSCLNVSGKVLRKEICQQSIAKIILKMMDVLDLALKDLNQCSKKLCRTLQSAHLDPLNSIYRKYLSRKYLSIATIQLGRV